MMIQYFDIMTKGYKFVIQQKPDVRKQFLILNGAPVLGFIDKGKKFASCFSYKEITSNVNCKVANVFSIEFVT